MSQHKTAVTSDSHTVSLDHNEEAADSSPAAQSGSRGRQWDYCKKEKKKHYFEYTAFCRLHSDEVMTSD